MQYQLYRFSVLFFTLIYSSPVFSYTLSTTQGGRLTQWAPQQKVNFAGNSNNASGISTQSFWNAVVFALQQWKEASGNAFDFDYWQGTDSRIYPREVAPDGLNAIFFVSQTKETMDPNVIGYTQSWFNSDTGELLEADVILNDVHFTFTQNPADTSSAYTGAYPTRVYLNNIVTHELGHALGLSHSSDINSSMLYVEFREQAKLGCDDWLAIRHLYSSSARAPQIGSLAGTILTPQGDAASGVVVTALSKERGLPVATVHTNQAGEFNFGALEFGKYALQIKPFHGSNQSIPTQMRAKEQGYCNTGTSFSPFFLTENSSLDLKVFNVNSPSQSSGTHRIQCNSSYNYATSTTSDFFIDTAYPGQQKFYTFQANGSFKLVTSSYLIGSPVSLQVQVYDESGSLIPTQLENPIYSSTSQFSIPDQRIVGQHQGTLYVTVQTSYLPLSYYPAPAVMPETTPYFVISFSDQEKQTSANSSSFLPSNARCTSGTSFKNYQSPPGTPARSSFGTQKSLVGFCGSIANIEQNIRSHPKSHSVLFQFSDYTLFEDLLGWSFPFWVALSYYLYLAFRRNDYLKKIWKPSTLKG